MLYIVDTGLYLKRRPILLKKKPSSASIYDMQHDIACISETTYYIVCLPFYLSSFEQWGVVGIVLVWQNQNRNLVRFICAGGVSLLCLIFSMIMKHWNFSNPEEFKGKTNKLLPFIIKMIWWFYWRKFGRLYTLEIFNKQPPHTEYNPNSFQNRICPVLHWLNDVIIYRSIRFFMCMCV